jgi:hypothetical protein
VDPGDCPTLKDLDGQWPEGDVWYLPGGFTIDSGKLTYEGGEGTITEGCATQAPQSCPWFTYNVPSSDVPTACFKMTRDKSALQFVHGDHTHDTTRT